MTTTPPSNTRHHSPPPDDAEAQLRKVVHLSITTYHELPVALAERLVGVAPAGLDMVFFANSGSEAVDGAPGGAIVRQVERLCLEAGVLVLHCDPSGEVLRLLPPLTIEETELMRAVDVLERAFTTVERTMEAAPTTLPTH